MILTVCRLREAVRKMEEKHYSENHGEHVEFLPVEWRSKLALDGGKCVHVRVREIHSLYLLLQQQVF